MPVQMHDPAALAFNQWQARAKTSKRKQLTNQVLSSNLPRPVPERPRRRRRVHGAHNSKAMLLGLADGKVRGHAHRVHANLLASIDASRELRLVLDSPVGPRWIRPQASRRDLDHALVVAAQLSVHDHVGHDIALLLAETEHAA